MLCESFLSDISSIIFSLKFYHLRDEVGALQSLRQRGSARGHVEHAAAGGIDLAAFRTCAGVIHLHAFDPLRLVQTENLFSIFNFARITVCHQNDRCCGTRVATPGFVNPTDVPRYR